MRHRERKRLSIASRSAAQRWGQDRERHLLQHGPPRPKKEVPSLEQFTPRSMEGHAKANRQKPRGIAAKETILNIHLVPLLGAKRLDEMSPLAGNTSALSAGWFTTQCRQGQASCGTGRATCPAQCERGASAAAHILFASRDAGGSGARDSGPCRASGPDHDTAVHALESRRDRQCDSTAGFSSSRPASWQHGGNGIYRGGELLSVEQDSWRGRRDSNPRPPA